MLFENLGLSAELLRAINEQGYGEPTPIQQQAIPLILEGRDVLAGEVDRPRYSRQAVDVDGSVRWIPLNLVGGRGRTPHQSERLVPTVP